MKIEKEFKKMYNVKLTYDELNAIYHALGNYSTILNNLRVMHLGLFLTEGEDKILKECDNMSSYMRSIEPDLYCDLSFER